MVEPSPEQRADAQAFVQANTTLDTAALRQALAGAYGDAFMLGAFSGAEQVGASTLAGMSEPLPTDWPNFWDKWEPGNLNAAIKLDQGGFAELLTRADVTIRGITETTLNQIGSRLAEGALNGDSVDTVARSLREYLDDPTRAYTIANTELNRAVTSASLDQFAGQGVDEFDLVTSPDACPVCVDVESSNPHPVTDDESAPPLHPSCRCAAAPSNADTRALDLSEPDSDTASPVSDDDDAGPVSVGDVQF